MTVVASTGLKARPRRKEVVIGALAVGYAVLTALASFGLPSLLTAWGTSGDELELRTAYVVWGVLAGLFIPALALSLVRSKPAASAAALACLVVAALATLALAFEPENAGYLAVICGPAAVLWALHPRGRDVLRPGVGGVDRLALSVAAVMTLPGLWHAVTLARESAATSYLDTMHGQYAQGAVLSTALVLTALVSSLRQSGWRFTGCLAALAAAIVGLAGIVFPDDLMSVGRTWGALTVVSAVVYATALLRTPRTDPGPTSR